MLMDQLGFVVILMIVGACLLTLIAGAMSGAAERVEEHRASKRRAARRRRNRDARAATYERLARSYEMRGDSFMARQCRISRDIARGL